MSVEQTVTKEREDEPQATGSMAVDGEDEVIEYLQEIVEAEADQCNFRGDFHYDTVGRVTNTRLVEDPDADLRAKAGLPRTETHHPQVGEIQREIGEAFNASDD